MTRAELEELARREDVIDFNRLPTGLVLVSRIEFDELCRLALRQPADVRETPPREVLEVKITDPSNEVSGATYDGVPMTRVLLPSEKFERAYAARSGMTVRQLRAEGRIVAPCDCGQEGCEGWQSVNGHSYFQDQAIYQQMRDSPPAGAEG